MRRVWPSGYSHDVLEPQALHTGTGIAFVFGYLESGQASAIRVSQRQLQSNRADTLHLYDLVPGLLALDDTHPGWRYSDSLRDHLAQSFVCPAFHRWRGHSRQQDSISHSDQLIAMAAGAEPYCDSSLGHPPILIYAESGRAAARLPRRSHRRPPTRTSNWSVPGSFD